MPADASIQGDLNARLWQSGEAVAAYAHRVLSPPEVIVLSRYASALSGRVLELGCGAGRVLGYLTAISREAHGIDIAPDMVAYCRLRYPDAQVRQGDARELRALVSGSFDAVIASFNFLDMFDHGERLCLLKEIRNVLSPDGLLVFSSHNLAYADGEPAARTLSSGADERGILARVGDIELSDLRRVLVGIPRRWRNRRRLAPLQQRAGDHAILNDVAEDYGALHYYVRRDDQERQLRQAGYELIECLDLEGRVVAARQAGYGAWLHYVARPTFA